MKCLLLAVTVAGGALLCFGSAAQAANRMIPNVVTGASSIEQVGARCGPHEHWVPEHWEHGRRIPGHCV